MSFVASLLAWANVPFTVALGVAIVFALLQMTGVLGLLAGGDDHGDSDGDADASGDADGADAEGGDADGADGHDADTDADADADHDHDHDHGGQGAWAGFLGALGVGKVPLSVVWQTFAMAFGFAGLAANAFYLSSAGGLPTHTLAWTLPIGLVFGFVTTRSLGRVLGRLVANPDQEATPRKRLVGQMGVVISSKVNDEFGEIRLRDKAGNVVRIICKTRSRAIAEGKEVVVVEYDSEGDQLFVAALDEDTEGDAADSAERSRNR